MSKNVEIERKNGAITGKKSGIISGKKGNFKRLPNLDTMFEDDGDPLEEVNYEQELEKSADEEMSAVLKALIERRAARFEQFRIASDPEYWVALCFQSQEQKLEFLEKIGWLELGDKYINGLEIARRMSIDVQSLAIKPIPLRGKVKNYKREEVI